MDDEVIEVHSVSRRQDSFEALRLIAMAIITVQHAMSAVNLYPRTIIGPGLTYGQFGVSIFCAITGFFALRGAGGIPAPIWLARRLSRIYPALWIVIPASYAAAMIAGRPVHWSVFASQMLGTGYFTNGFRLINNPTWYVSLILLCLVAAAIVRTLPYQRAVMLAVAATAAGLMLSHTENVLSRHVVTFALAAVAGTCSKRTSMAIVFAALCGMATMIVPSFAFAAVALLALAAIDKIRLEAKFVEAPARHVYEYFLVHGVALNAAVTLIHVPSIALPTAIACAMIAAVFVRKTTLLATGAGWKWLTDRLVVKQA